MEGGRTNPFTQRPSPCFYQKGECIITSLHFTTKSDRYATSHPRRPPRKDRRSMARGRGLPDRRGWCRPPKRRSARGGRGCYRSRRSSHRPRSLRRRGPPRPPAQSDTRFRGGTSWKNPRTRTFLVWWPLPLGSKGKSGVCASGLLNIFFKTPGKRKKKRSDLFFLLEKTRENGA